LPKLKKYYLNTFREIHEQQKILISGYHRASLLLLLLALLLTN